MSSGRTGVSGPTFRVQSRRAILLAQNLGRANDKQAASDWRHNVLERQASVWCGVSVEEKVVGSIEACVCDHVINDAMAQRQQQLCRALARPAVGVVRRDVTIVPVSSRHRSSATLESFPPTISHPHASIFVFSSSFNCLFADVWFYSMGRHVFRAFLTSGDL